jgi:hypothetical protein
LDCDHEHLLWVFSTSSAQVAQKLGLVDWLARGEPEAAETVASGGLERRLDGGEVARRSPELRPGASHDLIRALQRVGHPSIRR